MKSKMIPIADNSITFEQLLQIEDEFCKLLVCIMSPQTPEPDLEKNAVCFDGYF